MIQWQEDKQAEQVIATTYINGVKYRMCFEDYYTHWYVSLSSGKKRRELDVYEQKPERSHNSWEVVKWCLECIADFPYKGNIVVQWADNRRKRIYGRILLQHRFRLVRFENTMCYLLQYK